MFPEGLLPKSILVLGSLAIYNALQTFIPSMRLTHKIYARRPQEGAFTISDLVVTPLMSRMMGTWTLTSALIRVYTAYHIDNPVVYQLCLWSFVIAFTSFFLEVFVYKTAPLSSPGVFPAMILSCKLYLIIKL